MPVVSAAQLFPAHILQAVVGYMPFRNHRIVLQDLSSQSQYNPGYLIPLLGVCRQWRHAICPLFYYSGALELSNRLGMWFPDYNCRRIEQIARNKCQKYIQKLVVVIELPELVNKSLKRAHTILGKKTVLSRVRTISFVFRVHFGKQRHINLQDSLATSAHLRYVTGYLQELFAYLAAVAPNTQHIEASSDHDDMVPRAYKWLVNDIPKIMSEIAQHFQRQATPASTNISNQVSIQTTAALLQSITLSRFSSQPYEKALVINNALTLVHLAIEKAKNSDIVDLVWADKDLKETYFYPCLRHLRISQCAGMFDQTYSELQFDPFPEITTLTLGGNVPVFILTILTRYRRQLRRLDICINAKLLAALVKQRLLCKGEWTNLDCTILSFRGYPTAYLPPGDPVFELIGCFATTRKLHLNDINLNSVMVPTARQCFSENQLQYLDIHQQLIKLDVAIVIFNSAVSLQRAKISLADTVGDCELPTLEYLNRQLDKYRVLAFGVQYVELVYAGFASNRRYAEFIVLLAAIVRTIDHVCLNELGSAVPKSAIVSYARTALERPIYQSDSHLQALKLSVYNVYGHCNKISRKSS